MSPSLYQQATYLVRKTASTHLASISKTSKALTIDWQTQHAAPDSEWCVDQKKDIHTPE